MKTLLCFLALALPASALTIDGSAGGGVPVRSFNSSDLSAVVTTTAIPVPSGGTLTYGTTNGRYQSTVTASTKFNQQLSFTTSGTYAAGQYPTWSSSNPTNAPISAGALVTHVTDGTYLFTATFASPPMKFSLLLPLTTQTVASTTFINWTAGLLGADLNTEVDSRITANGGTIATTGQLFTSANDTTHVYVRNAANVFHNLDFTGVSVWQSAVGAGAKFQMSLVTPTDAIGILHATPAVGTQFIFVDASNTNYTATVAATTQVDGFALVHLTWSGATPTTLKVYKVFPSNFQNYAPDHNLNYFPTVSVTQTRQLAVGDVTAASYTSYLSVFEPTETNRAPFAYSKYSGDSGFPIFAVMNGDLIYIAANYSTSGGSGPVVSSYITDLNAALAAFGGSYPALTQVSLASFPGPY
jgi:hypothetical protein